MHRRCKQRRRWSSAPAQRLAASTARATSRERRTSPPTRTHNKRRANTLRVNKALSVDDASTLSIQEQNHYNSRAFPGKSGTKRTPIRASCLIPCSPFVSLTSCCGPPCGPSGKIITPPFANWATSSSGMASAAAVTMMRSKGAPSETTARQHAEMLGHEGNHIGLADGLATGNRERLIRVGIVDESVLDEMLARHLVHGPQHCRIADAAPTQAEQELHTADVVVARRLLGHAESPPRPYPKTEIRPECEPEAVSVSASRRGTNATPAG